MDKDSNKYDGDWFNGEMHGDGIYTWNDGSFMQGIGLKESKKEMEDTIKSTEGFMMDNGKKGGSMAKGN